MKIPSIVAAGDTITWVDSPLCGPPGQNITAAAYGLSYAIRGPIAAAGIDVAGAANGSGWSFTISGTQSAALNAGATKLQWYWQAYATATTGGARSQVGSGRLWVSPNLAALSGAAYDGRSQEEIDLSAIQAAISARVNNGAVLEYTIGGRNLKREPLAALLALETRYKAIVAKQKAAQAVANGLGNPGRSLVRFSR